MRIIINDGNLFDGTLEQFNDCFFNVTTDSAREAIEEWCKDFGYNMKIEGEMSENTNTNNGR